MAMPWYSLWVPGIWNTSVYWYLITGSLVKLISMVSVFSSLEGWPLKVEHFTKWWPTDANFLMDILQEENIFPFNFAWRTHALISGWHHCNIWDKTAIDCFDPSKEISSQSLTWGCDLPKWHHYTRLQSPRSHFSGRNTLCPSPLPPPPPPPPPHTHTHTTGIE